MSTHYSHKLLEKTLSELERSASRVGLSEKVLALVRPLEEGCHQKPFHTCMWS